MATLSILEIENWSKGTEVLLTSPNILHYRVFRKWHTVAVVICAVRIFNSHISKANANVLHRGNDDNQEKKVRFSMGDVVNTVQQSQYSSLRKLEGVIIAGEEKEEVLPAVEEFRVEAESLARLVEEKKLLLLEELGGVVGIASVLRTDIDAGISGDPEDVSHRRNYFGENSYPRRAPQGFLKFLVEAFRDTTIIILMICSMLSLGFGIKSEGAKDGWYDGASIAFAVVLVVTVTAISDYRQSRQFQKLNVERSNIQVDVFRGGRRFKVSIYDLVVGDVVPLNIGDQVPADGLLVGGYSLEIDESSMTGESDLVHKDRTNDPFLVSGTKVANGFGSMLVTSVGTNTQWGQMMSTLAHHSAPQTPLQIRLSGVATFVGKIGLTVALVVLLVLLVRYFSGKTHDKNGNRAFTAGQTSVSDAIDGVVDIIAIAVTIVVVAIPEGLPLAVTLTLAYSMKKMMTDNALVRKLSACETMGSATTICTDKTGTLTLNQMTVTRAWVAGDMRVLPDQVNGNIPMDSTRSSLFQAVALNTTGSVYLPESDNAEGAVEVSGSPTEKAILSWALKMGMMNPNRLKLDYSILHVEAFNSVKKRSGVAIKDLKTQEIRVHWKGAAEIILGLCSHSIHSDGKMVHLDEGRRENLQRVIEGLAAASLRCIAFAYKSVSHSVEDHNAEDSVSGGCEMSEGGLALLAIVGLKDPCRPGVGKAVECCKAAGVNVRMVTGDNVLTAKAIALECGILGRDQILGEPTVIEGEVFRKYSPEQRMSCVDKICVMARSSPSDKLLMVQSLREKGHVVAVTGDGTNDAPALQEADIGLAMGVQGTEVAKESSDIIILDDNFSSVVTVVRWGRSVYANIQKFIQFQLTVNVAALVINFVAAVSSGDVPLTAVQLLWVNLIMDTLGALALATEPPTDELMSAPPVGRNDPLITNFMWRNLVAQSIYQITVLLTLTFKGTTILRLGGNDRSDDINKTMIFNTFVLCQVFNEFNARKPQEKNVFKGIAKNRLFMGIVGVTVLLQVLMVEFLKKFASTERLDWGQWIICVAIASFSWPIAWLIKYVPVPQRPFHQYMKEYLAARKKT